MGRRSNLFLPQLLTRESAAPPKHGVAGWLHRGGRLDEEKHGDEHAQPWYKVLWLTGVDYFSTLGYQPGIALLFAGALSPVATAILVLVTLTCALPIYAQVVRRSFAGQGSIALLENLIPGWGGKLLVLTLLGFAATDFVITMTLSSADAAEHAIHNPYLHDYIGDHQVGLTLLLLALLAAVFLAGFSEAIGLATLVAIPYIILNFIVLGRALMECLAHPEALPAWQTALSAKGDTSSIMIAALIAFPQLALGLSGFETGASVMPLIKGDPDDDEQPVPHGRIRNARKLLATAAILMSVLLVLSSYVTTLLIPASDYREGGKASGRAIAYLAHKLMGSGVGTVYDISTILILWFAGASAMAGLLHLIPRYLPRFGMAPRWVSFSRPLVLVLFAITVAVTVAFKANVNAQSGAYATGVLVLMLSAAVAAALALWREGSRGWGAYCWLVAGVFIYVLADNVLLRPDGLVIASIFIVATLVVSAVSRYGRATELRVTKVAFSDAESAELWKSMVGKKVNLAPIRSFDPETRRRKTAELRKHYAMEGPIAFLNVELIDNRSEFLSELILRVRREGDNYHIKVSQAIALANTIATISEHLDPVRLFLGLSRQNLVTQAFRYLVFGEGETGLMVYTILIKYWEWTPEDDVRPLIFLMSD
ncbi:MAG: hypothetical protein FJW39_14945 [Acidobacteria bacterium]|nr:hypothetical protein [Acidobacteriota bacterium]